ncbi:MAG TPA: M64 family metallopeptidase [Propionibacteriaceae bacterium]|nr:M64 family metallopeptidase [Propionibacteriaceae bacterium]
MTTTDGTVLGTTKIVNNGPPSTHWNIVILGDGYQTGQMTQYATDAQGVCEAIFATPPFGSRRWVMNVYRVDVRSTDSGADDPTACGGSGATARTYFDASFCNNGIRRLLVANTSTALAVAGAQVPQWNVILLIVNSTIYGGSGGTVAVFSMAPNAQEIALHELGHSAFRLADEYDYYQGCGVDTDRDNHPSMEPAEANVTVNSNPATIKWRNLIATSTSVPTMTNPDCTQCDRRPSPVPDGTVGAFEGAHYYHCRAFRPEYRCKMFELGRPFCAVCRRRILQVLPTEVPDVRELGASVAANRILGAGLKPIFTGSTGPGAWVWHQSPRGGAVVASGSTVTLQLRTGPRP